MPRPVLSQFLFHSLHASPVAGPIRCQSLEYLPPRARMNQVKNILAKPAMPQLIVKEFGQACGGSPFGGIRESGQQFGSLCRRSRAVIAAEESGHGKRRKFTARFRSRLHS